MNPQSDNSSDALSQTPDPRQQGAAANIIRSQIDAIYSTASADNSAPLADVNPYDRTHSEHPQPQADQWKAYHSAWQTYYQKYYEAYYAQATQHHQQPSGPIGSAANEAQQEEANQAPLTKEQALFDLRRKLQVKVRQQASKVRGSRHFVPIVAGLSVMAVFLFLQYNQVLFATVNAYVSPGAIDPQNIVIDPTSTTVVSQDPRLIIPKINVDVPVLYDVGNDYASQMAAMEKGVAHFAIPGANSHPGELGNTVLSGHSSNDLFDRGDYKFIFAQLEKLKIGDTLYANYQGTRYTYVITKTEVVKPTEVNKLVYPTDKPVMTLITCTPLGTSLNRLLVTAEQVSPDPAKSNAAPSTPTNTEGASNDSIPGGSAPTLIERLFGAR